MSNALLSMLGLGGGGLLIGDAYDKLGDVGDTAYTQAQNIGDDVWNRMNFTGYGVTSPIGTSSIDASGNLTTALSPEQQNMMDQYRAQTGAMLNPFGPVNEFNMGALTNAGMTAQLMQPTGGMEQDYYDKIRAMQTPEEMRQRSALESRLASQGRMGVQTSQYGGTPEQLALAKAQEEAQNTAAVQAIELARARQEQLGRQYGLFSQSGLQGLGTQADIVGKYGQMQYAPQAALLDALGAGTRAYSYEDIARRNAGQLFSEANMSGLEALLGSRLGQANLMGEVGSSMVGGSLGMLGSLVQGGTDIWGDIWGDLGGLWGGVTGLFDGGLGSEWAGDDPFRTDRQLSLGGL